MKSVPANQSMSPDAWGRTELSGSTPTEEWVKEKLDEIARSDMNSGDNSQVPAKTTEPNPPVILPNTGHYPYFPVDN